MKNSWRDKVDLSIKDQLEIQVAESAKHIEAYKEAADPANAQLWCAIANLSKQVFELNLRIKYLENSVKGSSQKGKSEIQEGKELMKKVIGIEKVLEKEKQRTTKKGKVLKKALERY